MTNLILQTFEYYVLSLIVFLILFLFGYFFIYGFKKNKIEYITNPGLFYILFIGLILIITLFSCLVSQFQTVFVFSIPILFLLRFYINADEFILKNTNKLNFKSIILFMLTIYILIFVNLLRHWEFTSSEIIVNLKDWLFYAKLSNSLLLNKIENCNTLPVFVELNGVMPYHYGELWFTSCISYLFNKNDVFIYSIIYPTIFQVIILIGIKSIISNYKYSILFLIPILMICGIETYDFNFLFGDLVNNISIWTHDALLRIKLLPLYLIIIMSIFLYKKSIKAFFIVLSLCPIYFYSTLPFFILFSLIFFFISILKKEKVSKGNYILIITSISIFVFYNILFIQSNSPFKMNQISNFKFYELSYFKSVLFSIISGFITNFIAYFWLIPILILDIYSPKSIINIKSKLIISSCLIALVLTFLFVCILNFVSESFQMISNIWSAFFFIYVTCIIIKQNINLQLILFLGFFILNFPVIKKEYLQELNNNEKTYLNSGYCNCNLMIFKNQEIKDFTIFQKCFVYNPYNICFNKNINFNSLYSYKIDKTYFPYNSLKKEFGSLIILSKNDTCLSNN